MKVRMIPKWLWDKWPEWDREHNDRIGIVIKRANLYGIDYFLVKKIKPTCEKRYEKEWIRSEECQIIEF